MVTINLIWIMLITVATGLTLLPDGVFHREDVCADARLSLSCGSGQSMVVQDVQYGTKPRSVCSLSNRTSGCCRYDAADCFLPSDGNVVAESCSGKILCDAGEIAATDRGSCNDSKYHILSHYLTTVIKCVPDTRIGQSSSASLNDTAQLLYLQNTDYPAKVRAAEDSSSCSVETRSCSSKIKVYFVHFGLADGGGQCTGTQQIRIEDRDVNRTYTCFNNTNYAITMAFTSSSNYLKIEFKNPGRVHDGNFWIGFEETDTSALLTLDCPSVSQTICMDCQQLSNITDGTVSTDGGLSTGQNATYRCNLGYNLTGDSVRTCQENGTWDSQEPSCQIIECPVLSSPDNGNVSTPGGRTYGETANYTCQYGYNLVGNTNTVCKADESWNGTEPTCELIVCPALNDPSNGSVAVNVNSTVDQTANYTCDQKFRLEGDSVRVCQNNATWSSDEPVCTLIICPNLTAPVNGTVILTGQTIGEKATYSCNHGYTLSGEVERTCWHNGAWTGSDPECLLKTCDVLTNPVNGIVSTDGLAVGETAIYSCSLGYLLSGDDTRTCRSDYTWSGAEPVCKRRALGSDCTTEADCSAAVSGSTCNNSLCVCPEGMKEQAGGCVTVEGETKEEPDDGLSAAMIIIIAVAAVVVLIAVIAVVVICRKRNRKSETDSHTDNVTRKDTENGQAYNNNAYNDIPPATAVVSPYRLEEDIEVNESAPRVTEPVIDKVHEQNKVTAANQVIQQPDADQSDKSVMPNRDINRVMVEDEIQVDETSNNSKEISDSPRTDSVIEIAEREPETSPEPKTKCTTIDKKTGETEIEHATADTLVTTSEMDAIEKEIKEADMSINLDIINLDRETPQVSISIKDLAAALFRSASIAKRNLIARGRAGDYRFEFETTEDSEWSRGLLKAAKEVMAAIYNLCNIANELAEGNTTEEMLEAAAQEIRRATKGLIVAYRVEGDLESSALQELKDACIAVSKFADSLVESTVNQSNSQTANRRNVTLDGREVQKSKKLIEAQATVLKKEKELSDALKTKAELNQQLNKFDKDEEPQQSTEL